METHLKSALASLRLAQEEILHPGTTYAQLDDLQSAIADMIEDKVWEQ